MLFTAICSATFLLIIFPTFGQWGKSSHTQQLFLELQFVHNEQTFLRCHSSNFSRLTSEKIALQWNQPVLGYTFPRRATSGRFPASKRSNPLEQSTATGPWIVYKWSIYSSWTNAFLNTTKSTSRIHDIRWVLMILLCVYETKTDYSHNSWVHSFISTTSNGHVRLCRTRYFARVEENDRLTFGRENVHTRADKQTARDGRRWTPRIQNERSTYVTGTDRAI